MSLFSGITKETAQQLLNDRLNSGPITVKELAECMADNPDFGGLAHKLYVNQYQMNTSKKITKKATKKQTKNKPGHHTGMKQMVLSYIKKRNKFDRKQIDQKFPQLGPKQISNVLSHLKEEGWIYNVGRGKWEVNG